MKKTIMQGMAYWFLKTGSIEEAYKHVTGSIPSDCMRNKVFANPNFSAAVDFWITRFRENGMADFKLNNASNIINEELEHLQDRMKHATHDEYVQLANIFMSMMGMFGGNWSGFSREESAKGHVEIEWSKPRQLKPAKQVEEVEFEEVNK